MLNCRRRFGLGALVFFGSLTPTAPGAAQVIEGRATGDDGVAVEGALIGLYDEDGNQRAVTLSNEEGFYRLEAPGPGEYLLGAERIGFSPFWSPLLAIGNRAEPYQVDLEMLRAPVPIEGITVTADRREDIERQIRLMIGVSPKSLRREPILRDDIIANWERGRDLPGMLQWGSYPGLIVKKDPEGFCYEMRGVCAPVFLNGMALGREWSQDIPLELLGSIVLLGRNESIAYPGGAVLLYTEAWIR